MKYEVQGMKSVRRTPSEKLGSKLVFIRNKLKLLVCMRFRSPEVGKVRKSVKYEVGGMKLESSESSTHVN